MKTLLLTASLFLVLTGCDQSPDKPRDVQLSTEGALPTDATERTDVGGGWVTFKYQGHKYLYRQMSGAYGVRTECVTLMPEER